MPSPFAVDEQKLRALSATTQGRVSQGGFIYQSGWAAARLASMASGKPLPNLTDVPERMRYDWGDDLDETLVGGGVLFTQSKRVDDIGQPGKLAEVFTGFAPKWLWSPAAARPGLRLRLICNDPRFRSDGAYPLSQMLKTDTDVTRKAFTKLLSAAPTNGSDRALWQADANSYGHAQLFDALWAQCEAIYVQSAVIDQDPASPLLPVERQGLDLLLKLAIIPAEHQKQTLRALRALVHDNLVDFDPDGTGIVTGLPTTPQQIDRATAELALLAHRPPHRLRFEIIERTRLREAARQTKQPFIARPPAWADVVHGEDKDTFFLERSQTDALQARVERELLAPMVDRIPEHLRVLFVLGAPGAGKTTLVRRVAARLALAERVVIADTHTNLDEIAEDEFEANVDALDALAQKGRPVLLLLDDPLSDGSGWPELLKHLAHSPRRVAVFAACPDFAWHGFRNPSRRVQRLDPFELLKPDEAERRRLAAFHGRDPELFAGLDEEFLVLSMVAAAGRPFREIIERLWVTLNHGEALDPRTRPDQLRWEVKAFLIVCFFHRVYGRCTMPLLREALRISGGDEKASFAEIKYGLDQLAAFDGWKVFRLPAHTPTSGTKNPSFVGALVTTAHARIAREAWECRPVRAFDVGEWVVPASVEAQTCSLEVGAVARQLAAAGEERFAKELLAAWGQALTKHALHVRNFGMMISSMSHRNRGPLPALAIPDLQKRLAILAPDTWLVALILFHLSSTEPEEMRLPAGMDTLSIIRLADFSFAANRATQFYNALRGERSAEIAFLDQLLEALRGSPGWKLDSSLLTFLLARAAERFTRADFQHVVTWLDEQPGDTTVRGKFLNFLTQLPEGTPGRVEAISAALLSTADWLDGHEGDSYVRTSFLAFVAEHGPRDLVLRAIKSATSFIERNVGSRGAHSVVSALLRPYRRIRRDFGATGDRVEDIEILTAAHDVATRWLTAHKATGLFFSRPPRLVIPQN